MHKNIERGSTFASVVPILVRALLCALVLGLAACAGQPSGDAALDVASANFRSGAAGLSSAASPQDYLIGPQDLLKIEVFGIEALNRSVRVNSTGKIGLPLIGMVQAGGLTSEQLAADIGARLTQDYLQNPQVIIFIEEYTSQRVTVVGAVKKPGVYPVKGRTTLLQVVAGAEGPTSVANIRSVKVLRPQPDGTRKVMRFDLKAIRDGRTRDPEIRGEDVVQVDSSVVKDSVKQTFEFILPFWVIGSLL